MKFLFNSQGKHIANVVNGELHSTSGKNIGHFIKQNNFFIDMRGYYLGEIVLEDRLLYRKNNGYQSTSFGSFGNCGNVGNYGNPGHIGSVGNIAGFEDISIEKLN